MKKLIVLVVLFVALAATAGAYPQKPVLGWDQTEWGWSDSEGVSRPVAVDASGTVQVSIVGGVTITIGSTTFTFSPVFSDSLGSGTLGLTDSGRRIVVNIGSETIGLLTALTSLYDAIGSSTAGLATPTITTVNAAATAFVTNTANRAYIIIQNQGATETVYVYPGATATPGQGIAVYAGGSILRAWDSDVQVSYAATTTTQIVIDQEVRP